MELFRHFTLAQDAPTQQDAQQATDAAAEGAPSVLDDPSQLLDPDNAMHLFETYGLPAIKAIIIILVAAIIAGWARRMTVKAITKAKVEVTLAKFFGNIVRWAILVIAGIVILGLFGIETTSFAAVLAALGFAIGMALSGSLGNVAAGVMLLIFRPFKVGDVVNVAGVTGKVDELELFTTTLDTPDNRRIIIPNGSIFGSVIENITHHPVRRVDVNVGVEYSAAIDKTREVLEGAIKTIEGQAPGKDPAVVLVDLGNSSVNWTVRVWAPTPDFFAVKERTTRAVKMALDNADIGIPFPQMDVHLDGVLKRD